MKMLVVPSVNNNKKSGERLNSLPLFSVLTFHFILFYDTDYVLPLASWVSCLHYKRTPHVLQRVHHSYSIIKQNKGDSRFLS